MMQQLASEYQNESYDDQQSLQPNQAVDLLLMEPWAYNVAALVLILIIMIGSLLNIFVILLMKVDAQVSFSCNPFKCFL